jgi:hypothetical protein
MTDALPVVNATLTVTDVKDVTYQKKGEGGVKAPAVLKIVKSGEAPDLSSFDTAHHPLLVPGAVLSVGYTEKFATMGNGAPLIDDYTQQQKVYRNIVSAAPYGARPSDLAAQQTQAGQAAAPVAQATPTTNAGGITPKELFSLHQTALNGAISLTSNGIVPLSNLYEVADDNFAWLMGQPVDALDRAIKVAKDAGMTEDGGASEAFTGPPA